MSEESKNQANEGAKRPRPKKRVAPRKTAPALSSRARDGQSAKETSTETPNANSANEKPVPVALDEAASDSAQKPEKKELSSSGDAHKRKVTEHKGESESSQVQEASARAAKAKPSKRSASKEQASAKKAKEAEAARAAAKARAAALSAAYEEAEGESAEASSTGDSEQGAKEDLSAFYNEKPYRPKSHRPSSSARDAAALRDEADRASSEPSKRPRPKRKIPVFKIIVRSIAGLILVAVIASISLFCWEYWFRYDDAASMEGTWLIEGSDTAVIIADGSIRLNDEVSYDLSVDGKSKTITSAFGNFSGESHYRFSLDRTMLFIEDASTASALPLLDDAGYLLSELQAQIQETSVAYPNDPDVVVLVRHDG